MFFDEPHGLLGLIPGTRTTDARATRVTLADIPEGIEGTKATLRAMRGYVRAAVRSPDQIIRRAADGIIQQSGASPGNDKNWTAVVRVLHAFVRDAIRYQMDPAGVELIQTPEKTLEYMSGDCDDKSTLLAALLESVGHPCRFWAVGFDGNGEFSHVLVETLIGTQWVPLETILDVDPGWRPSGVTDSYRLNL
jgi:transglutaminase-like putative cysteine protease